MPAGRPLDYPTVEELQTAIDSYFKNTPQEELTITGLALALGFTTRQALINYQERAEFVDTVKSAKLKIENAYELSLRKNGRAGDIFGLKNFDWSDKTEHDHTTKGKQLTFTPALNAPNNPDAESPV